MSKQQDNSFQASFENFFNPICNVVVREKNKNTEEIKNETDDLLDMYIKSGEIICSEEKVVDRPFLCDQCGYKAQTKPGLISHSRAHNHPSTSKKKYLCNKCEFQTNYLVIYQQHLKTKHNEVTVISYDFYSCNQCDYQTTEKCDLDQHIEELHKIYKCGKCGYKSKWNFHLTRHMKICTKTNLESEEIIIIENEDDDSLDDTDTEDSEIKLEKCYVCDKCEFSNKRKTNLDRHLKLMHSNIDKETFKTQKMKPYKCHICPYRSKWAVDLNRHFINVHKNVKTIKNGEKKVQKQFVCTECPYFQSDYMQNYKKHVRHIHHRNLEQEKDPEIQKMKLEKCYSCDKCDYSNHYKCNLESHLQRLHTDIRSDKEKKPHKCTCCPYSTKWAGELSKHFKSVHKNTRRKKEKKFVCGKCPYFQSDYLLNYRKHLKLGHRMNVQDEKSLEKPENEIFKCSFCLFETTDWLNLKSHISKHV